MEYLNEEGLAALWDDTKEYVEKYHGENSGEQESDGTEAGPISELTAKGHAEQFTTLGKNLFDESTLRDGDYDGTSKTIRISQNVGDRLSVTQGQTFTLSGTLSSIVGRAFMLITNESSEIVSEITQTASLPITYTVPMDGRLTLIFAGPTNTKLTVNDVLACNFQLELGSTATSYEPYTGGAPSPSPDYPQEIQVVRGRNLLDESAYEHYGIYSSDGFTIRGADASCTLFAEVEQGETYVISRDAVGSSTYYIAAFYASLPPDDSYAISYIGLGYSATGTVTVTAPVGAKYIGIFYGDGKSVNPMLERGSVAHPYVPYGNVGLEADMAGEYDFSAVWYVSDGEKRSHTNYVSAKSYIPCKPNTRYSLVMNWYTDDSAILWYDGDKNYLGSSNDVNTATPYILNATSPTNARYMTWDSNVQNVTEPDGGWSVRLVTTTPIPLPSRGWVAGLPDGTADTLTLDGAGKVVWSKATEELSLAVADMDNGENYPGWKASGVKSIIGSDINATLQNVLLNIGTIFSVNTTATSDAAFLNKASYGLTQSEWKEQYPNLIVRTLLSLATPITEQLGYVDLPDIPEGASLSIPELDDLRVKYHVDASPSVLVNQLRDRFEGPIAELQSDVAEIATDAATTRAGLSEVTANELYDAQVINDTYAGRSIQTILGTSDFDSTITALHNRVTAANFDGLRIGDYVDVAVTGYGTIRYRIAAFDHYYNCGDTAMPHHIVFVPNAPVIMPSSSSYTVGNGYILWNTTADNNGTESESNPYLASNLHAWEIGEFLPALPSALQSYLKDFRDLVEVRYNASSKLTDSTGWKWASLGKVWSPSEMEVYGTCVWGTKGWSQGLGSQFPIFRNTRDRIRGGRVAWWLRVAYSGSSSDVCIVTSYGNGHSSAATTWIRPLPCFLLG